MKTFYITFGANHVDGKGFSLKNCYTTVQANELEQARKIALAWFGQNWSSIYQSAQQAQILRKGLKYVANPRI